MFKCQCNMFRRHPKRELTFEDKYDLGRELGHGVYGIVYEGTDKTSQQKFAIKKVDRAKLDDEDERSMQWEMEILQMLCHPNIVACNECIEEPEHYYLVTELMEGGELFERIARKSHYSEFEARNAIRKILGALAYMHENKVVHRDLKPENILMVSPDDDEHMKIADFGFAEIVSEPLTLICGTPEYIAPEILKKMPYTFTVDLWSAGVIFYILIGGYPPFSHKNLRRLFQSVVRGRVYFDPRWWGHVSDEAKDFLKCLLEVDPNKRLTAEQALMHPWLHQSEEMLSSRNLMKNQPSLKEFNQERKLKAAVNAVLFLRRVQSAATLGFGDIVTDITATPRMGKSDPLILIPPPATGSATKHPESKQGTSWMVHISDPDALLPSPQLEKESSSERGNLGEVDFGPPKFMTPDKNDVESSLSDSEITSSNLSPFGDDSQPEPPRDSFFGFLYWCCK